MRAPLLLLLLDLVALASQADEARFFNESVLPILEKRCFECHSHASGKMKSGLTLDSREGWAAGGERGPAIVPGDPEKSLLVKAIRRQDPELKMPPKLALPSEEISAIEQWIKAGAIDPRAAKVASGNDTNWWSLRSLTRPKPPGPGHPVDAFIEARLAAEGIEAAKEADRRTLIRRATFDLHGLLLSPEETDEFVNDPDPQAYDKLIERLLNSPRYGERWTRHWLDVIHYADTHGFEHDLIRSNAWRYRDYVIDSFNRDTPWPRFIKEQLAADVLFPDQPELTPALGFIGAGLWDQSTAQTAPRTFDVLDRDDMVTQTMSAFASATVHCARCHDHKFDPISQEDYYSLQAVFAGVGKGDILFDKSLALARERRRWRELQAAAESTNKEILLAPENQRLVAGWESKRGRGADWKVLHPEIFATAKGSDLKRLEDGSLLAIGAKVETEIYTVTANAPIERATAARLEVLSDPAHPKNGPGRAENGNLHLSEFSVQLFKPGATQSERMKIRRATADFDQDGWTIQHALDGNDKTAWGIHPHEGQSHTAVFEFAEPVEIPAGSRLVFQLLQLHGAAHVIGKFRLAVTGSDPTTALAFPAAVAEALATPESARTETQRLTLSGFLLKRIAQDALAKLPAPERVFAAGPDFVPVAEGNFYKPWKEPKAVHILARGDIEKPRAPVKPGALAAIASLPGRFEAGNEGARRAALAEWLAHTNNPLTWRSIANRVWQHHFDRGLSDSPNDFGRMGSEPTHPELLDWLACELRENGGSLKALRRLILTSAAYRRSAHGATAAARDPENRLLARRAPRRMDAESVRDNVLAIAGRLDLTMGGPGVQHFKLAKPIQLTPTVDYNAHDWDAPGANRRSIYRFIFRGLPDPFMDALDFPDAAQLAAVRPFSASALQTSALMNNDFILRHCERVAERLKALSSDDKDRVRALVRLALQRQATPGELYEFGAYAEKHGFAALARVVFNSNEFLFVD